VPPSEAQNSGRSSVRERGRRLLRRVVDERSAPHEIGKSVGVGVFAGCTPFGAHAAVALGLATAFRLNRLWAFLASRAAIFPVYLAIAFAEIEAGHLVRTGAWAHLRPAEAFARRYELTTDWVIGTLLVGVALGMVAGLIAYACARRWQKPRAGDGVSSRTPGGPPRPSLGSPTSAPPDPTP
jgi:uncharacterized protein (DUF2062 family)